MNETTDSGEQQPQSIVARVKELVGQLGDKAPQDTASASGAVFQRIHVIVNPASGPDRPILKTLNTAFNELELDWEMFVTRRGGDGKRLAEAAVSDGVDAVVVYGGDGSVLEVAGGLLGSNVPLVILPGGTANVLAMELGIPGDLAQAALLLDGRRSVVRAVDMGMAGKQPFFHMGIGIEGKMVAGADRRAKDNTGTLAYIFAALKELRTPQPARFRLTLDGETADVEGLNCMITTFGSIGIGNLKLSHTIDLSDGLLDVIIIRDVNLQTIASATADAIASGDVDNTLLQWQARQITVEVEPPQVVVCDGEALPEAAHIAARVVPGALRVVVPAPAKGQ